MRKIKLLITATLTLFLASCTVEQVDESLAGYERINKFIIDGVQTYYLWEAETDWKKYDNRSTYSEYKDHDKLFGQLRFIDDKWSTLTDDIDGLENQFAGISTTFGYTLGFYYNPFTNNDEVIAVVYYTSYNSPAAKAGLKRGDILIEMNGKKITVNNRLELYYSSSIQVRCGKAITESKTFTLLPELYSLSAVTMYENPVNTYSIIEKGVKKIGYLCYTGYQSESERELFELFASFKSAGVNDIVLDLRYNPGGYARTAQILSSILAPAATVKNKSVYLEHYYNAAYTAYLKENKYALNETFIDTLPVNMNLSRVYFLTGKNTASASEATIVGLKPYMQVTQIGDTTSGKFCGGFLLSPEDLYGEKNKSYYSGFSNWGMYIMIYRYANINGIASFAGPIAPDIVVKEDVLNLKPFGDEDDPLLGQALAHIMGVSYSEKRSATMALPLAQLPSPKKFVDGLMITTPVKWDKKDFH